MRIILVNSELPLVNKEPCCVCLGMFDGVHRGHQALLEETVRIAKQKGLRSAAATFLTKREKNCIDTLDIQLSGLGEQMDFVFVFLFDEKLRGENPEEFISHSLKGALNARHVVCGFNFRFGHNREGDTRALQAFSRKYGYGLSIVPPVKEGAKVISSTRIRAYLREGKIGEANRMLGRPFALSGFVRMGNQIGRTLKMPTINVPIDPCVIELQNGVYASKTEIDGEIYESITNIGTAPTFQEKKKISETFILNFHQDVYNKTAKIFLYHFLRGERKFSGPDELVRTIKGDIERCAQYY